VNLALGHLLSAAPDCIISGINIGHNAGLAYLLSSGTVGAALEGALHGIPAFAASLAPDRSDYDLLKDKPEDLGEKLAEKTRQAADIFASFVSKTLAAAPPAYGVVHKLNFPSAPIESARIIRCQPAQTKAGSFFAKQGKHYSFRYQELGETQLSEPTDREVLKSGNISYTLLDYSRIGG